MSGDARDGAGGDGAGGGGGGDDDRAHARIEAALREVGAELTAPAGWEDRVLAALAAEDAEAAKAAEKPAKPVPAKPRRHWWTYALSAATTVVFAAVLLWVVLPREALSPTKLRPPKPNGSELAKLEVLAQAGSDSTMRGESGTGSVRSAKLNEVLSVTHHGMGRFRALWVFRGDELLIACPGDPRCTTVNDAPALKLTLDRYGEYVVFVLDSDQPLPSPVRSSLDRSRAAVLDVERKWQEPVRVE